MAATAGSGKRNMKKEMQEILENEHCEEMSPGSDAIHSGIPSSTAISAANAGRAAPSAASGSSGRTTPPTSLAVMPDHIFGTTSTPGGAPGVSFRGGGDVEGDLESPSKVLGGSTSWTGGLSHGCAAVFRNNETTATTSVPLNSPGSASVGAGGGMTPSATNGNGVPRSLSHNKLETIKNWTISTYKCSRQTLMEKLGKTSRTVDVELEGQIEALRDTQRKYSNILRLARALTSHFYHVVQTQSALGEAFSDLANRSPELSDEFLRNSDTQKTLVKNGEILISALNFFVSSVNTLCHKTIEDTIVTVRNYETARLEYDAYRSDLEYFSTAPKTDVNAAKQRETQSAYERQKLEFEKLRSDVQIKLKFLDENRVKVMHKQLLLFHNAVAAYFSGNSKALEETMSQFSIKMKSPNSTAPSWVEQ